MAQILVNVSDGQKELWVAAAHDERVSLSEWLRRAGDARAGGDRPVVVSRLADPAGSVVARSDREVKTSSSGCPGYVPAGVRCKLCGQVHQPKGRK